MNVASSVGEDYNHSATIFIGNKIDLVDAGDREEVKKMTTYKLKQCFPSIKNNNIIFMSVLEVSQYVVWSKFVKMIVLVENLLL